MKTFKKIVKNYEKKYGYTPSNYELIDLYLKGELILTDAEENEILKLFTTIVINS